MRNNSEEKLKGVQALAKRYNTTVHSTESALRFVKTSLELDPSVVLCWVGPTGVGKTVGTRKLAKELDRYFCEIRSANIEKEDVTGLPKMNGDDTYSFAAHKPLADMINSGKPGLVFIDEINRGGPAVVKAFFNVIENKRFGDLTLPEDTMFVVAMNPADHNYSVADIMQDKALKKRFRFVISDSDATGYLNYIKNPKTIPIEQGHPIVVSFLETYPQHVYDNDALECGQLFATPYHWSRISRTLRAFDKKFPGWEGTPAQETLISLIEGDVGTTLAEAFDHFVTERSAVLKPDDIVHHFPKHKAKVKKLMDEGRYDRLSELTAALAIHLTGARPRVKDVVENVFSFLELVPAEAGRAFIEKLRTEALKSADGKNWQTEFNREATRGCAGKAFPAYTSVMTKLYEAEKSF